MEFGTRLGRGLWGNQGAGELPVGVSLLLSPNQLLLFALSWRHHRISLLSSPHNNLCHHSPVSFKGVTVVDIVPSPWLPFEMVVRSPLGTWTLFFLRRDSQSLTPWQGHMIWLFHLRRLSVQQPASKRQPWQNRDTFLKLSGLHVWDLLAELHPFHWTSDEMIKSEFSCGRD